MTEHVITHTDERLRYTTTSHQNEYYHEPGAGLCWRDFEDQTLGPRFKQAMIRLECLMYAIFGARPDYDSGPTDGLWYKRIHPRCMWGPEQWKYTTYMLSAHETPETGGYKETAAFGDMWWGDPPVIPKRSRSGDPNEQFARGNHWREVFPLGSVARSAGAVADDPQSTTYNAVLPAEDVRITWTPPEGVTATLVQLYTNVGGPYTMVWDAGNGYYYRDIAAQAQDVEVRWYIRALTMYEGSSQMVYDPYGATPLDAPTMRAAPEHPHQRLADSAYTYVQFSHYNFYGSGLPEYLHWWDQEYRKNLDTWEFTPDENVDPRLINLCRFVLDWLGQRIYHSPHQRASGSAANSACCFLMHMKWYWTGGNVPGHYVHGGKGGTGYIYPLTARPAEEPDTFDPLPSTAARRTWRGVPRVFEEDDYYDNPWYGGNESWLSEPERFYAEYGPDYPPTEDYGHHFWLDAGRETRGLRPGDVIDAAHVEEIIAAIDHLVRYGVWQKTSYCSHPLTPGTFQGHDCGDVYIHTWGWDEQTGEYDTTDEYHVHCDECCSDCVNDPYGETGYCIPHSKPASWADCVDPCLQASCELMHWYTMNCEAQESIPGVQYGSWDKELDRQTNCDCTSEGCLDCGEASDHVCCGPEFGDAAKMVHQVNERVGGWSKWICGPKPGHLRPDAYHGGGLNKERLTHTFPPDIRTFGAEMGNRWGDIDVCAEFAGDPQVDDDLWFETVAPMKYTSPAAHWNTERQCSTNLDLCYPALVAPFAELPGYGGLSLCGTPPSETDPLCWEGTGSIGGGSWTRECYGRHCECCIPGNLCEKSVNEVWVAINLNVDDSGAPYGDHPDYVGPGDLYPKLYPYVMPQPTGEEWTATPSTCPCETYGEYLCE